MGPGRKTGQTSKTVFRGGYGIFYYRFPLNNVLNTHRYNGNGQQNYTIIATTEAQRPIGRCRTSEPRLGLRPALSSARRRPGGDL